MVLPIGQDRITGFFRQLIQSDRLGHAYLLFGDKGCGKKTLCDYITHMIMCTTKDACMRCNGCLTVSSGANPDVLRISNEDKASIGVEKIREMIRDVFVRPIISDKKVIIIENAHLLTKGAQNALLKVIEEPPGYAVFFLLCDSKSGILQTVISRVNTVNIPPLGTDSLRKIVPDATEFLYHYCRGNAGRLMELRDDEELKERRDSACKAVMSLKGDDGYEMYDFVPFFESGRPQANVMMDLMLMFVRDVILHKSNLDGIIINKDKINDIKAFSASVNSEKCFKVAECIQTAQRQLGKSGSLTIAAQTMFIKCREVIHGRSSRSTF